jgi:hypothetical protein
MTANRPRPLASPQHEVHPDPLGSSQPDEPPRPSPLEASLRRRTLASALQFDTPDTSQVGPPPRFNRAPATDPSGTGQNGPGTTGPGTTGNGAGMTTPNSSPTGTRGPAPDRRGAPAPGVAWNTESVRFPTVPPRTPAPPMSPANGSEPQYRASRVVSSGGAVRPSVGNGRHPSPEPPVVPTPTLPEALKAFAPGSPNILMDVAAMTSAPLWKPGDDDVMPGDGRRARRPRLWERLPW